MSAEASRVLRTEWLRSASVRWRQSCILFIEVTRAIEQEDFEGWLKNRLLGGA